MHNGLCEQALSIRERNRRTFLHHGTDWTPDDFASVLEPPDGRVVAHPRRTQLSRQWTEVAREAREQPAPDGFDATRFGRRVVGGIFDDFARRYAQPGAPAPAFRPGWKLRSVAVKDARIAWCANRRDAVFRVQGLPALRVRLHRPVPEGATTHGSIRLVRRQRPCRGRVPARYEIRLMVDLPARERCTDAPRLRGWDPGGRRSLTSDAGDVIQVRPRTKTEHRRLARRVSRCKRRSRGWRKAKAMLRLHLERETRARDQHRHKRVHHAAMKADVHVVELNNHATMRRRGGKSKSRMNRSLAEAGPARTVQLSRDKAHPRPYRMHGLRAHRRPRRERRGERPQLGTNERGRAGPGRLQPGGLSPVQGHPRPTVPGAAGKPWAGNGPCEAGARQAPGSTESTGFLSLSESAGNLSEWTVFVLTHSLPLACRRDMPVPRGGFRQGGLDAARRRVPRRMPGCRIAGRGRAFTIGRRGARLVLLRCAGVRGGSPPDGLPSAYPSDVDTRRARHVLLRPAISQPGTMPRGGFGNLIALPLQREPRAKGNSVFVDDGFRPVSDQWSYLAGMRRIPASAVERVAGQALPSGQVLGGPRERGGRGRHRGALAAHAVAPFALSGASRQGAGPCSRRSYPRATVVHPQNWSARSGDQLAKAPCRFPESGVLPAPGHAAVHGADASHHRLCRGFPPTRGVAARVHRRRGCFFRDLGATLEVDDQRATGQAIEHCFRGALTGLQEKAVRALLAHDIGVLVAPPGVGKTVAAIRLIAERARSALVLVHRRPLLDQWVAQLAIFLDVEPRSIGRIGGGKRLVTGRIDVAMIQSFMRKGEISDRLAGYGHVVVDECHHVPAVSFERVLSEVRARYLTGLTATPRRRDGQHPILEMQLGPARFIADRKSSIARPFAHRLIVRETAFELVGDPDRSIQHIYRALVHDDARNALILDDVIGSLAAGHSPIVLTERKDHLELLADRLRGFSKHLIVLSGGVGARKSREALATLDAIPEDEERLVLATGRYIGEGFDDARLDTLFLTMPVSWRGTVVQYTGRLHRSHPGKTEVRMYDYVDRRVPVLARMYERRFAGYRSIGYHLADEVVVRKAR